MGRLLIIGTGGQGKVVLDCAKKRYEQITFMTNDLNSTGINGYPIIYEQRTSEDHILQNFDEVIVAIGDNAVRLKKSLDYATKGLKLATMIHETAVVSESAKIGDGTVIFANAVINPDAVIGRCCIINTGSIIEHDCRLADGVHVSPNAAMGGGVTIGEKAWICLGSNIADSLKIGKNSVVGAGSVIINDVPDNVLVAGVPAKIKKHYKTS